MEFASHGTVNHTVGEYVRDGISTNEAECFFAQFKRSPRRDHHNVSGEHLQRYATEFEFRGKHLEDDRPTEGASPGGGDGGGGCLIGQSPRGRSNFRRRPTPLAVRPRRAKEPTGARARS